MIHSGSRAPDFAVTRTEGCWARLLAGPVDWKSAASKTIVARGRAAWSHFLIVTNVTAFTKLFARTNLPSRVTDVLRTILPPPGITQLWNFSVFGSKRTTVLGAASDSLYQMTSLITEMP